MSYTVEGLIWKNDIMEKIGDEIERRDVFFRQDRKMVPGLRRAMEIIRQEAWAVIPEPKPIPAPTKKIVPEKPKECLHKYRDYSPYLIYRANAGTGILSYRIMEPYLCLKCKERKDVCLEEGEKFFSNIEEYKHIIVALNEQYPFLRDRAVVEDEINDDMLVDREYLRAVDVLQGKEAVDRSIKLVLNQPDKEATEGGT